jgi:hypothetical protein
MDRNIVIGIVVISLIAIIIVLLILYILTYHYMHHSYSSGSWINKQGDMLIVRNLGPLSNSQFKLCENNGEDYDVLESTCKILTNPFSLPHKFSMYILDKPKLTAKVNMLTGRLKLYSGDTFYGTFYRNGFQ